MSEIFVKYEKPVLIGGATMRWVVRGGLVETGRRTEVKDKVKKQRNEENEEY